MTHWLAGVAIDISPHAELETLWQSIFVSGLRGPGGGRGFRIDLVDGPEPPGATEVLFKVEGLTALRTGHGYRIRSSDSWLDVIWNAAKAECRLHPNFFTAPFHLQRGFLQLALLLGLGRLGIYSLHAAALEAEGSGVLATGDSGSGKTTLALSLLARGWKYVSDDAVLLRQDDGLITAHAYGRGFSCTAETRAHFPEAKPLRPLRKGKSLTDVEGLFPGALRLATQPRLLLLTCIGDAAESRMEAVDAAEAVAALVRQSPAILHGRDAAAGQMVVLRALCAQIRSFRFVAGTDVLTNPAAVASLVLSYA